MTTTTNRRVTLLSGTAALGGFLFGYDSAVINGAVGAIAARYGAGSAMIGFTVSAALLGAAIGAWFAGRVADRYSRVRTMTMAGLLFAVSAVGSAFPFGIWDLTFWRFVGGVGTGFASVVAPMYIAEIAPAALRGRLGTLQQLAIVSGIFSALLVSYVIVLAAGGSASDEIAGIQAWQWMFLSGLVPSVIYAVAALRVPRSPRWLVLTDRDDEAAEVIASVDSTVDPSAEVAAIRATLIGDRKGSVRDLRGPLLGLMPIVWVGIVLSVLQQFVGINVIFYYSSTLWRSVGFSEDDSLLITVITSVTNIVVTIIALSLVDRLGRRPLLLIGSIGMSVALSTMAVVFATAPIVDGSPVLSGAAGPVALVAANVFVFFFGLSWGPVVWVLLGEMFPNRIRAIALSVAAAAQWGANWLISTTFPWLSDRGLGLAYGIYAGFAIVSVVFVLAAVRETKGRTLESMSDNA